MSIRRCATRDPAKWTDTDKRASVLTKLLIPAPRDHTDANPFFTAKPRYFHIYNILYTTTRIIKKNTVKFRTRFYYCNLVSRLEKRRDSTFAEQFEWRKIIT